MRFTHLLSYPGLARSPRSFNGGFVFLAGLGIIIITIIIIIIIIIKRGSNYHLVQL